MKIFAIVGVLTLSVFFLGFFIGKYVDKLTTFHMALLCVAIPVLVSIAIYFILFFFILQASG